MRPESIDDLLLVYIKMDVKGALIATLVKKASEYGLTLSGTPEEQKLQSLQAFRHLDMAVDTLFAGIGGK